jgi:hypothetical protein
MLGLVSHYLTVQVIPELVGTYVLEYILIRTEVNILESGKMAKGTDKVSNISLTVL